MKDKKLNKEKIELCIIGGGASGMLAAYSAKKYSPESNVVLIEKNEKLGKKILITGKGRCNLTSNIDIDDFYSNIPTNSKFLYSTFNTFSNKDLISLIESLGVKLKIERGERIFPVSDKAKDIVDVLEKELNRFGVKLWKGTYVKDVFVKKIENGKDLKSKSGNILEYILLSDGQKIYADRYIFALGGASYPVTGSDGKGYVLAEKMGHKVLDIKPSLVPLKTWENVKDIMGLSLKNIELNIKICENKESNITVWKERGELLFTHFGITGPIVLTASTFLHKQIEKICNKSKEIVDVDKLFKERKVEAIIDLKPALSIEKLDARILREIKENINKEIKTVLNNILPRKMVPYILKRAKISENINVNNLTKEDRLKLVYLIKNLKLHIQNFGDFNHAVITHGGIDVKEIDPKTMKSKILTNTYCVGEMLNVDGVTGGFNLQIAFSTGYQAGKAAVTGE